MANRKICLISLAVLVCWASVARANPRQSVELQELTHTVDKYAEVVIASFAAGKIHQVKSTGRYHWLIVSQSLKSSGDGQGDPWLVIIDAAGTMQQSVSLSAIPELTQVTNWGRIPIAITDSGGLALLAQHEEEHATLLEFSPAGQIIHNRKVRLHLHQTGGLLGVASIDNHWLVFGSRGITRFDEELKFTEAWQADAEEFVVAYDLDQTAGIRLVSVKEAKSGFQWQLHSLNSADLAESARLTFAHTDARHFLVRCLLHGRSETIVVAPDLKGSSATWNLARISSDGEVKHNPVTIPQNFRRAYATRVFLSNDRIHFLSIENGRARHTIVDSRGGRLLHTGALELPGIEGNTLVTGLESASNGDDTVVAINYLAAHGKNPIRAAVLISLRANASFTP